MLFRNIEIRNFVIADILILVISLLTCFFITPNIFPLLLIQWILINIAIFTLLYYRYLNLSKLALEIDKVLHSSDIHEIAYHKEGELNILGSEINKMIIRINEQTKELSKDKLYLVDSLADLSHQIKTPLTSLILTNTMLLERSTESHIINQLIVQKKMLNRIQWLIDVLLKISRLDADVVNFSYQNTSCSKLIDSAYETVAIILDVKNQTIIRQIPDDISIQCDINWLSEAISNILKNCAEHTPENGIITVTIHANALFSQIIIEDNGPGFDPEDIPHLFDRFYKGIHSSNGSIGIGLALSKSIIQKHNGRLYAYNRKEGGACFDIKLYKAII